MMSPKLMQDDVTVIFIGQPLCPNCEFPNATCVRPPKIEKRGGLPLLGLIWLYTLAIGNPVRKWMFPECREITVRASEVRDVYVTGCYITKVTIIGDPKDVRIHAPNILCGK